ncbi:hypothetical protein [Marinobacter salarius]|uniref:hypothetical protein n=1 Tax=Marinobacter salarius TaxID=1420917 RepID=UPI003214B060
MLRKVLNIFSSWLIAFRYRNKPDPFEAFKKMREGKSLPEKSKGNILILPIRVSPVSNLFEGIYSYAFALRGYEIHALICDQFLKKCDNVTTLKNFSVNCALCKKEAERFEESFSVKNHSYKELIDEKLVSDVNNYVDEVRKETLFSLNYKGVDLGKHIKSAVMRYLLSSDVDLNKYEGLAREYAKSTIYSYEATKALISKVNPKFVLTSHGVYSTWGGALEACIEENIESIVWARGYIGGNIIASRNMSYLHERAIEPVQHWNRLILTDQQKNKVKKYFYEKRNPSSSVDHVNYYSSIDSTPNDNVKELIGFRSDSLKFGLFPNIPWDGTTFSYSDSFPTITEFLEETLIWFKEHSEFDLIIRAHPAEIHSKQETIQDVIKKIMPELPPNIFLLAPDHSVNSYQISEICEATLLYASTMALELAYFGVPVIQAGKSNASNKGIVFEPESKGDYLNMLRRASMGDLRMSHEMKEDAERYAFHWLYRRHFNDPTHSRSGLVFEKYNIESVSDLEPGKLREVDWFVSRCEDSRPFIYEN